MSLSTLTQPMEQRIRRTNDAITPFTLAVSQTDLEDLNRRIDQIRDCFAEVRRPRQTNLPDQDLAEP